MQVFEDKRIREKVYVEELPNKMQIMVVPKTETQNKYIIWATKFGSIDNHFVDPTTNEEVVVPDGIAHYLEHKMFEQKSGVDSLYTLMGLGLNANAYTTSSFISSTGSNLPLATMEKILGVQPLIRITPCSFMLTGCC